MRFFYFILFSLHLAIVPMGCVKDSEPDPGAFADPRPVIIDGYGDHAMEPFISRDGLYLFFNNLNDGMDTSLHYAIRVEDGVFEYRGPIVGVNGDPPHLDAVASMDQNGMFYYTSTRSYFSDWRTIYTGDFADGVVTGLATQEGDFYREEAGWLVMDAEVSPDGQDIYYSQAHFSGDPVPDASDILVAGRSGDLFYVDPNAGEVMERVNRDDCLEYAPSISGDGLELFFTRFEGDTGYPRIYRATRESATASFGEPALIGAITGFAEAPSLSGDGKTLYYHAKEEGLHVIKMVTRP